MNELRVGEVGLRSGLRIEAPVAAEGRARLIEALVAAGAHWLDVAASVSPTSKMATGIDLDCLLDASSLAADLVGHPVPTRLAATGFRSRLASS